MRRVLILAACAALGFVPAARAAVTVGQSFTPTIASCVPGTALETGVASGTSYTVPSAGVISSWSFQNGAAIVPDLELKVGRIISGDTYKIVGASPAGAQTANTLGTYAVRISVHAGDVIGIYENGGSCGLSTLSTSDTYEFASGI